jgi:GDPmannose 4,6-dehydratase
LGNLDAKGGWGYAKEYVEAMWLMLQQSEPADYVIATGETHTVRELCTRAFARTGVELEWRGAGVDECGVDAASGRVLVEIDPVYFRPTEVDLLLGDASKARRELDWQPRVSFAELVDMMVDADLALAEAEARLR